MQKILGNNLTKTLSILFNTFSKKLFNGKWKVLEVTPPEFKKIKHSVNFSCFIEK